MTHEHLTRAAQTAGMPTCEAFLEATNCDWVAPDKIDEGRWYWWWNGDVDCCPVPVCVMRSGTDGTFFATAGQLGWERSQQVLDLGGLWMKIVEPELPSAGGCAGD